MGRGGQQATSVLYYDPKDLIRAKYIGKHGGARSDQLEFDLSAIEDFCTTMKCRRKVLYSHFDHVFDPTSCCKNCNCGTKLDLSVLGNEDDDRRNHYSKKLETKEFSDQYVDLIFHAVGVEGKRIARYNKCKFQKRNGLSRKIIRVGLIFLTIICCINSSLRDRLFYRKNLLQ